MKHLLAPVDGVQYSKVSHFSLWETSARAALYSRVRENTGDSQIFEGERHGVLQIPFEAFVAKLHEQGLRTLRTVLGARHPTRLFMATAEPADTWCVLEMNHGENWSFTWQTLSEDVAQRLSAFDEHIKSNSVAGSLYAIMKGSGGYSIVMANKNIGRPLVRDNYLEDTLTQYDRAVADLQSEDPYGRLVLVDGPTGSGKTWLLRGMIQACPAAWFVRLPAPLVKELNSPDFIPMIISERAHREIGSGPLVFLVEDGDQCLVPRGSDNMTEIQALLNTADGLLSTSFDMRVVITTNAAHLRHRREQIDEAMVRKGRLSARVVAPRLPLWKANEVLQRLTGKEVEMPVKSRGEQTLGDVYYEAREHGWTATKYDSEKTVVYEE